MDMNPKLSMKLEIKDEIRGFSPIFTRWLIEKLKALKEGQRIWGKDTHRYTEIAAMTIGHLENQLLGGTRLGDEWEREYIDRLIEAAEEFLAIFEGKSK